MTIRTRQQLAHHRRHAGWWSGELLAEPRPAVHRADRQPGRRPRSTQSGTGGTFGIAFLSDLEVYLFLTAAQGDTRSNVLQAPKVTTFNGAAATIFNNIVQYYVAGSDPDRRAWCRGVYSHDRPDPERRDPDRHPGRLGRPPLCANDALAVLQCPAPTVQTFHSQAGAVGGSGLGGGAATISTTVQLPETNTNTINTTVTVPDGGTVLLGGVKQLNEQRTEYGVPVLSKIPLLDRLFRNVGIGRTTSSVMLMVTPRIIILEEEEEKLGIPSVAY